MDLEYILEEVKEAFEDEDSERARMILEDVNLIELFGQRKATKDIIAFVISSFPNKILIEYLIDLINYRDDNLSKIVAPKLDTCSVSGRQWRLLNDVVQENDDLDFLKEFFEQKLRESNIKPEWVKKFSKVDIKPVPSDIPSTYEAIKLLIEDIEKLSLEENIKGKLISQYSISTIIEKIQMLSHIKEIQMFNDIPLFREFGPVNSIYSSAVIDQDHICGKHGGCRMFLCSEFEDNDYDEEESVLDWFFRRCQVCDKSIEHRTHSLRMPLSHGGWKGCYCSFKCLEEDIPDEITSLMVGRIKEQLETIGIRDQML